MRYGYRRTVYDRVGSLASVVLAVFLCLGHTAQGLGKCALPCV